MSLISCSKLQQHLPSLRTPHSAEEGGGDGDKGGAAAVAAEERVDNEGKTKAAIAFTQLPAADQGVTFYKGLIFPHTCSQIFA